MAAMLTSSHERPDLWAQGQKHPDDIPAMLSDGEFVVNAKSCRGIGTLKKVLASLKKNSAEKALA